MAAAPPLAADFSNEPASDEVRKVADWVLAAKDHGDLPFIIVDKAGAKLFLFDGSGMLRAVSPVLLGLARGDDSPPGIGEKSLAEIKPKERITPAGRFVAELGRNLSGEEILWVDYAASISLHRITDPKPGLTATGRAARLASASTLDNRISHGCINVSDAFFEQVVRPVFSAAGGLVYVLPETASITLFFPIPPSRKHAQAERPALPTPSPDRRHSTT
jgi:hypothetical protein